MGYKPTMKTACITTALLVILAGVQTQAVTFYDVLKADPHHKLVMKAVDSDPEGRLKRMLQDTVPITAFVPVDSAFIKAAVKLKLTRPSETAAFMKNHCLIAAILKQHMVPGRFDTATLRQMSGQPSMLITKKMVPNTKGKVTVSWPVKFAAGGNGDLTVMSVAKSPDPSNPSKTVPATTAQIIAPHDVAAGNGLIHNINGLLLPMTNLTRLMQITGCK